MRSSAARAKSLTVATSTDMLAGFFTCTPPRHVVANIDDDRDTAFLNALANLRAIAVAQCAA
jgi:hypothetical protein